MGGKSIYRSKKRKFHGNRHSSSKQAACSVDVSSTQNKTCSEKKLLNSQQHLNDLVDLNKEQLSGFRIIDLEILVSVFTLLYCPVCFTDNLYLVEDSTFGLCSNFCLRCKNCSFTKGFASSKKQDTSNEINTRLVCALRLIGKGFSAGKKFCAALNFPSFLSKKAFRMQELKLIRAASTVAENSMNKAAAVIKENKKNDAIIKCGVSVDGTWQRRGFSSLNGVVSAISVTCGKVLDIEVMSQFCKHCHTKKLSSSRASKHQCANHKGSSGNMEVVGAYRIFERSESSRKLLYSEYYGDGDSKGYDAVRDIYGKDSVLKLECIGHVQKRVGTRLRKLKASNKALGGKGKLTDTFINKLQNYYGIAIRDNVGNLLQMQSATIAAFAHSCSSAKHPMHRQCPEGKDSWCRYQRAISCGQKFKECSTGLPQNIIKIIQPTYMQLCDQDLLKKCLHGRTQNANESFNNLLWTIVPKNTFVELQTLRFGASITLIIFNDGFHGLLEIFHELGIVPGEYTLRHFLTLDNERIVTSKRQSLTVTKVARKKLRAFKKRKSDKIVNKEGVSYKCGEF
ncbi:hypothetical protein AVEN_155327-1 [Araneus ventricosus]|uniref:Mutator-like transposase domain-containing protein n=1 Tax=Araneus ventricosus TaxID=182803 RepID=A0A4Y2I8M8_ARAVE|nr:hypothetical protein AVEN_155327-1 [Araneus ventricosus]